MNKNGFGEEPPENEELKQLFYIMLLGILFLKFMVEAYFEKINPSFGHNTGVVVLLGIICSWGIYFKAQKSHDLTILTSLRFDPNLFFDLILPAIVFPSGFNMRRKKFFRNLLTIMKFGFVGTIICFAIYTGALYGVFKAGLLSKINHTTGETENLDLDLFQILSICSLLCSSDVIAAISMISYDDQPKLFSIVYGEGVFNDIVSIILFNTVQGLRGKPDFNIATIIGNFILLAIYSLLIGIAFGVFSSILFKTFRPLSHSAVTETCVLFIIALVTYFCSEAAE
jgi:NhaP-type Na+/H+ or K+/H+ antiporter